MEYKLIEDEKDIMKFDEEKDGYCRECDERDVDRDFDKEYDEPDFYHMKKTIEVDRVLGIGWGKTNFEVCIPIVPAAFEIIESQIEKEIKVDHLIAKDGQVFVNGHIVKNIPFKTRKKDLKCPCKEITELTFGDIRHVTAKIPFSMCIDVRGAYPGAKVEVLEKKVESVEIANCTKCKCCNKKYIRSLTEKDCVKIKVKVVRDEMVDLPKKDKCDWLD